MQTRSSAKCSPPRHSNRTSTLCSSRFGTATPSAGRSSRACACSASRCPTRRTAQRSSWPSARRCESGSSPRLTDSSRSSRPAPSPPQPTSRFTRFVAPNALYHMQVWGLRVHAQTCGRKWTTRSRGSAWHCVRSTSAHRISSSSAFRAELSSLAGVRRPRHPARGTRGATARRGPVGTPRRRGGAHAAPKHRGRVQARRGVRWRR